MSTPRLLMIEDDARLAQMVGEYLERSGFGVAHAADATPALRLSAEITATSAVTSWPWPASQANSRLLAADSTAPSINTRITPQRTESAPPRKAPTSVMITPYTLVTAATSSLVYPMST